MKKKAAAPEADDKIWEAVASTVTPLKNRQRTVFATKSRISLEKKLTADVHHLPHAPDVKIDDFEELTNGDIHFMDRNTGEKFKKGKMPIDAVLDLHGYVLDKAFERLKNFIYAQSQAGARCILIVTGRGKNGKGVIRSELPAWLNHVDVRSLIVSFVQARQKDGGDGAFYVLLKRRRTPY